MKNIYPQYFENILNNDLLTLALLYIYYKKYAIKYAIEYI